MSRQRMIGHVFSSVMLCGHHFVQNVPFLFVVETPPFAAFVAEIEICFVLNWLVDSFVEATSILTLNRSVLLTDHDDHYVFRDGQMLLEHTSRPHDVEVVCTVSVCAVVKESGSAVAAAYRILERHALHSHDLCQIFHLYHLCHLYPHVLVAL